MHNFIRFTTVAAAIALAAPVPARAQDTARAHAAATTAHAWRVAHQADLLAEYRHFLALPNVASDSANIRINADSLVAMLGRRGVTARLLDGAGGPPDVYGELNVPGATSTIILYAHYDGQPVTPSDWVTPPWTPVLRDRALYAGGKEIPFPATNAEPVDSEARIYARSASDDKAPIMAMLAALDAMHAAGIQPASNVHFFFDGEEEAGSPHVAAVLERNRDLLRGDLWLFCDGPVHVSGRQQIVFGVRGSMGLELTLYGPSRPLHSGHFGNWAPNPAAELATLLASMRDDDGHIRIAHYYDDVQPLTAAERAAIAQLPVVDDSLRRSLALGRTEAGNALLASRIMLPALNVRGIRAGAVGSEAANAIPTRAQASIDFRLVPNETPAQIRELVEAHVRSRGYFIAHDSVTGAMLLAHPRVALLDWESGYPATRVPVTLPIAQQVLRAFQAAQGESPLLTPMLGGSLPTYDFAHILGAPIVIVPIVNPDNNQHGKDENLRLANLWRGVDSFAAVMASVTAR